MKRKYKTKKSYYQLKKLFHETKAFSEKNKKDHENDIFEDSPEAEREQDYGRHIPVSYSEYYHSVRYNMEKTDYTQPSGVTSLNKNYDNSRIIDDYS